MGMRHQRRSWALGPRGPHGLAMRAQALVLVASTMLGGCFPMTGRHSEPGLAGSDVPTEGQQSQEISTIGLVPLAGHVIYWWRSVPDDGAHPVEPWARKVMTPLLAVLVPAGIVAINGGLLFSPTIAYVVRGCGEHDGIWGGGGTLVGKCTTRIPESEIGGVDAPE